LSNHCFSLCTTRIQEADQYAAQRKILRSIGCDITDAPEDEYSGIKVVPGPAIVLKPNFVKTLEDYKNKFPTPEKVKISARSTLVVRGKLVDIYSLDLDGTLIIDVPNDDCLEVRDLVVKNEGWVRVKMSSDEEAPNEIIKMRGYRIERKEGLTIRNASDMQNTTPNSPPRFVSHASFDDKELADCGVFSCFK
jgi:UDP-sugar pyrophosphorylase